MAQVTLRKRAQLLHDLRSSREQAREELFKFSEAFQEALVNNSGVNYQLKWADSAFQSGAMEEVCNEVLQKLALIAPEDHALFDAEVRAIRSRLYKEVMAQCMNPTTSSSATTTLMIQATASAKSYWLERMDAWTKWIDEE